MESTRKNNIELIEDNSEIIIEQNKLSQSAKFVFDLVNKSLEYGNK